MKVTLALIVLFLFSSCQLVYEDNERLFFKGQAEGLNKEAIAGIPVEIYASNTPLTVFELEDLDSNRFFDDIDLIGKGFSNSDGSYGITTISPQGEAILLGYLNRFNTVNYNPQKPTLIIYDLSTIPNDKISYSMPLTTLPDIIPFQIRIERSTNTTDTLVFTAEFPRLTRILNFTTNSGQSNYKEFLGKEVHLNTEVLNDTVNIVQGDTLLFNYTIKNRTIISSGRAEIIVSPSTNEYIFEF